jgi:Flp pilus assembly protein TadG
MGARVERSPRSRERGAELVELAIALPLLVLLVFGVVELGLFISRNIRATQGVRESARQAVVSNYAGGTTCSGSPNQQIRCFTRNRIGLGSSPTQVAVNVLLPQGVAIGNEIVVCASVPTQPIVPFIEPFIPDFHHSKVEMRIERLPPAGQTLAAGGDPALSGDNWSWCT